MNLRVWVVGMVVVCGLHAFAAERATRFTVATYNLEGYLDAAVGDRAEKSAESRAKIQESILALRPDVLAVQEIGRPAALQELRAALKAGGLDYPHWEHVSGFDTNIFVAVLSRFPIVASRPHTNENFLLQGRRFRTSRGFAEVDIQINDAYRFTLITAHLKSRRSVEYGDEASLREQEALLLRAKVDAVLKRNPAANLIVLGDFNDLKDSKPVQAVLGRGRDRLVDTRPAERNGDTAPPPNPRWDPRNVTWTHFYGKEDSYQRIDYILVSPGMAREWDRAATQIITIPNWGVGSDHRPILAGFRAADE